MDLIKIGKFISESRKKKNLTQEELAEKLYITDRAVSKWERGLSVPDSDMLITISDVLETPVSVLLGEKVSETKPDDLKVISERLEAINLQLARRKTLKRKILHYSFVGLAVLILLTFLIIVLVGSPYLTWDYSDPETAVMGTFIHAFEFVFVRLSPFLLIGLIAGAILTRKQ